MLLSCSKCGFIYALTRYEPLSALLQVQNAFAASEGESEGYRRPIEQSSVHTAAVKTEGSGSSGIGELKLPGFGQMGSAFRHVAGQLGSPAAAFARSGNKQTAGRVRAEEEVLAPDGCAQGKTQAAHMRKFQ